MPSFAVAPVTKSMRSTYQRVAGSTRNTASNFWKAPETVGARAETSEFFSRENRLERLRNMLRALDAVEDDWNSYGSERPSSRAINMAWFVLDSLQKERLLPDGILPSAEGGVAFVFQSTNENRAVIENLNEGDDFVLLYDRQGNSKTLEWGQVLGVPKAQLDALRKHLKGSRLAAS